MTTSNASKCRDAVEYNPNTGSPIKTRRRHKARSSGQAPTSPAGQSLLRLQATSKASRKRTKPPQASKPDLGKMVLSKGKFQELPVPTETPGQSHSSSQTAAHEATPPLFIGEANNDNNIGGEDEYTDMQDDIREENHFKAWEKWWPAIDGSSHQRKGCAWPKWKDIVLPTIYRAFLIAEEAIFNRESLPSPSMEQGLWRFNNYNDS
ncbi:hypothetical protein M422DRAFT_43773 [Sphaerobolus stellatus SS14]|nr:hypothetical protein M422DRAFT_43773 [Sphaerobolus stellatus SS14]